LDRACEYLEEHAKDVALTIVDTSGHNVERTASLSRLTGLGVRVLVVSPEADADELLTEEIEVAIWDWRSSDLESLCWEPYRHGGNEPIRRYERDVARALSATTEVIRVHVPYIEEVFQAVESLRAVVEARGEDHPPDLDRALEVGYSTLIRLLRFPFRLEDHPRFVADISAQLDRMRIGPPSRTFLTSEECQGVGRVESVLQDLFSRLRTDNPKADTFEGLKRANPGLVVLCGDVDLTERIEGLEVRSISAIRDWSGERQVLRGGLISGWFNRRQMKRILRPPLSSPLYLLLNDLEYSWYRAFDHYVRGEVAARAKRTSRSRLFPAVSGWAEPGVNGRPDFPIEDLIVPIRITEEVEATILRARRHRLAADARPSTGETVIDARLVMFVGGGHAFLADAYRAKVATHLLDPTSDRGSAELEIVPARQLKCGDALLFLRGSERDVIRSVADDLLPPGDRERAGLWRRALLKFRDATSSSIEDVWTRLRELGCPLGLAAIRNWFLDDEIISPISAERELKTVCDLTRDPALCDNLRGCLGAISRVRGAHLRASRQLAQRVIDQAVKGLGSADPDMGSIEVIEGVILVRIADIDDEYVRVRCSAANRLVEA
jgi:hypothetical protein